MIVKETHEIVEDFYPFAHSIKDNIIKESTNFPFLREIYNADGGLTNVRSLQTRGIRDARNIPAVRLLFRWIIDLTPCSNDYPLKIRTFWISKYGHRDFTISHNHRPSSYSFVYFVNCPKGSSPLIFTTSGKRIKPEEGKVIIFPGNVFHHVPKNRCDNRIVLAGNMFPKTLESVYFSKNDQ